MSWECFQPFKRFCNIMAQPGYGYPPPVESNPQLQGGYQPPQGGYPPLQGGYPPPQGGYPPPQAGYPPPAQPGYAPTQPGYAPPVSQQPGKKIKFLTAFWIAFNQGCHSLTSVFRSLTIACDQIQKKVLHPAIRDNEICSSMTRNYTVLKKGKYLLDY